MNKNSVQHLGHRSYLHRALTRRKWSILAGNRNEAPASALDRNCCIILEKGDLFWSTTFVEVRGIFISRPFVCYYSTATLPLRSSSGLDARPPQGRGSVGGAALRSQSAAQLGTRRPHAEGSARPSCPTPALLASASETARRAKEREPRERDCAMAVSQPRPPDRVDAALEKVAPLRYLKAHECRAERAVTRYYHNSLSNNSFLSYNRRFEHFHEVFNGLSPLIQRYVNVFDFSSCKVGESLSLLVGEISLQSCISRLHKLGWLLIFEYSIDSH